MKNPNRILWRIVIGILLGLSTPAIAQPQSPLPLDELQQFTTVLDAIKHNYVEPVADHTLIAEAINGMLKGLDPHSVYLDNAAYQALQINTQGAFGGIGIEAAIEDNCLKVISTIENTPAAKAGIRPGDLILKIGQQFTQTLSLDDAMRLLHGKPNTPIRLTLARKGTTRPIILTLKRAVIKVPSVRSKMLAPGYALIHITQFQPQTAPDLVHHLTRLDNATPLKGIVLDLRNNPGGLLYSAIGVTSAFLPANVLVVSTDGRLEDAKRKYFSIPEHYAHSTQSHQNDFMRTLPVRAKTVPIVVLVNAASASAAEIVAGALQDHQRATLMGTQTFGKGSVQTIFPLSNTTAIKLTTARYFTPSGRSIQATGIVPDLWVADTAENTASEFKIREVDLDKHLKNLEEKEENPMRSNTMIPNTPDRAAHMKYKPVEFGSAEDYPLQQALKQLKGLSITPTNMETLIQ